MKKQVLFALLAIVSFGLASCTSDCTCTHEPAEPCKYKPLTLDLTVKQADWNWDNTNQQFYYHFDLPEITVAFYNYGNINVYHEYNKGLSNACQVALPQTICNAEEVDNGGTKSWVYYSQIVDYAYGVGYIEIIVTNSDYYYDVNPASMDFRVQLIY